MRVLNVSESTIFLDDINVAVIYSRNKVPFEIDDRLAKKSKNLRYALKEQMLIDVTQGVPDELPEPKCVTETASKPKVSAYDKRNSLLVDDMPTLTKQERISKEESRRSRSRSGSALDEFEEDGSMSVVWTGPTSDAGGYANMNRQFLFRLEDKGVNVRYERLLSMNDMDKDTNSRLSKLSSVRVPDDAPMIYGMTAPLHYDWSRYRMLYTMMETRHLHPDYVERCNCADEIVVPSRWCRDTFLESGVNRPISVVPIGVDTSLYTPDAEPLDFSSSLKGYVFLSVFGWSMRKGYDVLLRAYLEEFSSDDDVSLLISSRYFGSTDESKKKVIRSDVARVSSMVRNNRKPHLLLFGDVMPVDMMPRLYASADCYVLPSRGEGFGLPFCEAAACGLPVIATRYSGQTDFLDDENSYLIDVDKFKRSDESISWISYFYENQEFPVLGRKAIDQTRAAMRSAYENRKEAEHKAGLLRKRVVEEYSWDVCADQMYEKLSETFAELRSKR